MASDFTGYDPAYDMTAIMGTVNATTGYDEIARPGTRVIVVDYLSQAWQELLNGIRAWHEPVWRGEKLQSLCYRYHGMYATVNIVLAFNGLGTPMELRPGMTLRVPLKSELDRLLPRAIAASSTSQLGQTLIV